MSRYQLNLLSLFLCMALLVGCSRTVDDVAKWQQSGNVEKLADALEDPKAEVRKAAADALGALKAKVALDDLASCLNDEDEDVVLAVLGALESIGDSSVSAPLVAMLKNREESVRLKAVSVLGNMRVVGALGGLSAALDDDARAVRLAAVQSIEQIGVESGSKALIERLKQSGRTEEFRKAGVAALAQTGGRDAVVYLLRLFDSGASLASEAAQSLETIGPLATKYALEALQSRDATVRSGALRLVQERNAVPSEGSDWIWYTLATTSKRGAVESMGVVASTLAVEDEGAIDVLVDAAGHVDSIIREVACLALEQIGEPAFDAVKARATEGVTAAARAWFNSRNEWDGAPSKYLDFWGMLAALNPQFPSADLIVEQLSEDEPQLRRAHIPILIRQLRNPDRAERAKELLARAGAMARFPLLASIKSEENFVAVVGAELLAEQGEALAAAPIISVLESMMEAGEEVSESPLYAALISLNLDAAESFLRRVRPTADRVFQIVRRKHPELKIDMVRLMDDEANTAVTAGYEVGYIEEGALGWLEIRFEKNEKGEWREVVGEVSEEAVVE